MEEQCQLALLQIYIGFEHIDVVATGFVFRRYLRQVRGALLIKVF